MKTLLQDIMVCPEVTGALVCDYAHGLLAATDLPAGINGKPLAGICQSLGRLFAARDNITTIELHFAEGLLLAHPVSRNVTLLTFCVPSVNIALVNMTISMLLPNLLVAATARHKPPATPPAKPAAPAPVKPKAVAAQVKPAPPAPAAASPKVAKPAVPAKTTAKPVDLDALLSAGPLAHTLAEFQSGLAYAIGPVGEMVMRDALGEWGKGGDCSATRLNELVSILCREIDDPDLEKEFKKRVEPFL